MLIVDIYYGYDTTISTWIMNEHVCLSKTDINDASLCIDDYVMGAVYNQTGQSVPDGEGLMGFKPYATNEMADLFIEHAYQNGAIDQRVFSIYIGPDGEENFLTVGGYDLDQFGSGSNEVFWHENISDSFW